VPESRYPSPSHSIYEEKKRCNEAKGSNVSQGKKYLGEGKNRLPFSAKGGCWSRNYSRQKQCHSDGKSKDKDNENENVKRGEEAKE
jgi:hypothetical protein